MTVTQTSTQAPPPPPPFQYSLKSTSDEGRTNMGTTQEQETTNLQISQIYSSRSRASQENLGANDGEGFLSPRFKSVAAMAGWDEEALLLASLVVEDTPERASKEKKRPELQFVTPPTNSRRKRRTQRRSPVLIQSTILNLDDDDSPPPSNIASIPPTILDLDKEDVVSKKDDKKKVEPRSDLKKEKKDEIASPVETSSASSSTLPNIDKLRDELSCAICLEVCFEPSTTPCGHSFCKKCLRSAADKCGKRCPKCRQLISNGRSYTVNTVLWNTIQLLFPAEVEARKADGALNTRELERQKATTLSASSNQNTATTSSNNNSNYVRLRRIRHVHSTTTSSSSSSGEDVSNRRAPLQDEDAALALRLQREEFRQVYNRVNRPPSGEYRSSVSTARDNLRAMASRAISLRTRNRSMYN